MNCAIKLKGYEVAGSTFQDRKFIFTDRDISGDLFTAVVYNSFSKKNEIEGLKVGNEVFFPYSTLENLKTGRYRIEFWATMAGIGKEMIALEEFFVSSDPSCTNGSNETNVSITFKEEVINFTIQTALMYGGALKWENIEDKPVDFPPSAHVHQWGEIEDKPTVFYDDTGIKEEIAKKVDKVAGKSLSTNDFTDADKVKLASLENFDDSAIQTELDTKVDKIEGFGLSKNNFSDPDKTKLENLQNFDPSGIIQDLGNKVDKIAGKGLSDNNYSTADKTKLDNINLSNYVLQTSLNSQLTSYVLQSNLNTQLQSYATLNGVQTYNGTKTFTDAPIVPPATLNGHPVNLGQLPTVNVGSATKLQNARTFTLGNTSKTFDGSTNVAWTLAEIGAQAALTNPITGTATSGQVAFFNGTTTQTGDNGLFWDNTNKRLGIGKTDASEKLDVNGNVKANSYKFNLPSSIASQPNTLIPKTDGSRPIWYDNSSVGNDLALKSDIDNIQIGGRNLIKNSKGDFNIESSINYPVILEKGQSFIWSLEVKSSVNGNISIYFLDNVTGYFAKKNVTLTTEFTKHSENGICPSWWTIERGILFVYNPNSFPITIRRVKVEKGNKATDWTPAPEDKQDRLQYVIGNIGIGKTDASATEKLDVNGRIKSKAIVLEENTETLPQQITYENHKFYGTDSTGGKRRFQFADYQAWLDTVNGMTDAQKTEWKTAINGGWTTNTMSVVNVSPKVVKNSNLPTYITIEGANLNLNPTNFSLKLVDAITGIETVVPNSQVQLQTKGLSLIFWFNFSTLPIADYYIRLDNGVAILTTNSVSSIMVRDTVQNIDLSLLTWSRVCVTPAEIDNTLITGVNSFIFRQNANNTPLVDNNASVIAAAKSSQILSIGGNLVISGNIQIKAQNSVYNGFILGLAKSSISTQLVDITDTSIGFTADGSNWLNISKIINNVKSTLPSISLTSSTNLNLGFTIVKQGNVISITWRYTDQYNKTTSATVNKTITDTNYSLYLVGTSGNITGDNTIIINDIYKF